MAVSFGAVSVGATAVALYVEFGATAGARSSQVMRTGV